MVLNNAEISDWYLEGVLNNGKKWIININKNPFTIGREEKCHLCIIDDTISRKHAEIYRKGSTLFIKDLKSTNGTFLNNKRLKEYEMLKNADKIKFASIEFQILLKYTEIVDEVKKTSLLKAEEETNNFAKYYEITQREEEVLVLLLEGKSTREIAARLYISLGTAKNHILNVYKKTNAHSKFELLSIYNNFNA